MDKIKMPFGAKVLLIGAGPTGLILAQLMKVSGNVAWKTSGTGYPRDESATHEVDWRCGSRYYRCEQG